MTHPALPKAMLLDMDDTILALSETANRCWTTLCTHYADQVNGGDVAALHDALNATRAWFWSDPARHKPGRLDLTAARRTVIDLALEKLGAPNPTLAAEMAQAYTAVQQAQIVPLPGALAAVRGLRDRGVRLALLTNGEAGEQRRKIERFQLAPLFECVLVEGEFGVGKPEEAVYRHALAALDATPADAWMVGDNLEWEVVVPQRLGMYAVWVDHDGRGLPPDSPVRPDRTVRSISELLEP
jgi:putative hydrolase of the HAD superfamily